MREPRISVVVIGRNEAKHLAALALSLRPLSRRLAAETLYVDSASSDASVAVAQAHFDIVVELEHDAHLNASAGRWIGCGLSRGQWVLFLDGDMTLCETFVTQIEAHLREHPNEGLVGVYRYLYPDGGEKRLDFARDADGCALAFGGCVLLPRTALQDGGWDPRLFSNEEIELYTRLRARGLRVRGTSEPMVLHHTDRIAPAVMLRGLIFRSGSVLGKKFDGIGQVLAARLHGGTLLSFARWYPDPFVLWGAIVVALLAACAGAWAVCVVLLLAGVAAVSIRKGSKFVVVYLTFAIQAVYGWQSFRAHWHPAVRQIWRRDGEEPAGRD